MSDTTPVNQRIYGLPGILARSSEQYGPLGLKNFTGFDCNPHAAMDMHGLTELVIEKFEEASGPFTAIGSSIGAMQLTFILDEWLHRFGGDRADGVKVILVDPPTGVETMIAAKRSPLIGSFLTSPLGVLASPLSQIKIPPKDDYIEYPSREIMMELAGEVMSEAAWHAWVKATARKNLSGFSSKLWLSQIRWMIKVGRDGSLAEACEILKNFDVTLVACDGPGNDVVAQPDAANWWYEKVPQAGLCLANVTHCGYLQQVTSFRSLFAEIL